MKSDDWKAGVQFGVDVEHAPVDAMEHVHLYRFNIEELNLNGAPMFRCGICGVRQYSSTIRDAAEKEVKGE